MLFVYFPPQRLLLEGVKAVDVGADHGRDKLLNIKFGLFKVFLHFQVFFLLLFELFFGGLKDCIEIGIVV
jgi:hypothetical protein